MYLFYIYIQQGGAPDRENGPIYAKVLCDYVRVAEYVNYLNRKSSYDYYFMRESAYLDTDSVIILEKNKI